MLIIQLGKNKNKQNKQKEKARSKCSTNTKQETSNYTRTNVLQNCSSNMITEI